jgi:hypothetical protein
MDAWNLNTWRFVGWTAARSVFSVTVLGALGLLFSAFQRV